MNSYWEKIRSDPTRPFVLVSSLCFALKYDLQYYWEPHLLFLVLSFRFWVLSWFIANRLPPDKQDSWGHRIIANISKFIPSFYKAPSATASEALHLGANSAIWAGALFSTWALFTLGRQFGISPAKRGERCRTGPYRWLRHPIYIGYALVEGGGALLNHKNVPLFICSMGFLILRAHWEEKILA